MDKTSGIKLSKTKPLSGNFIFSLSGNDWTISSFEPGQGEILRAFAEGYPDSNAIPAIVPGDVHWDLERSGKIPPIYFGTNSLSVGWVSGKEWWYRKKFTVPEEWRGKNVRLHFDGVDYLADIWFNGQHLGRHEGQFTPFGYEVTACLAHGGENNITVLIHPAPTLVQNAVRSIEKGYRPIMVAMRETCPSWKTMITAGWDWGTKIFAMGIWKDVRLELFDNIYMSNPIVLPKLSPPYSEAILETRLKISSGKLQTVRLDYRVSCLTSEDQPLLITREVEVGAGNQQFALPIKIQNPRLWWPNGYGDQALYELEITACSKTDGSILHSVRTTFGIRDLQMLANPEPINNERFTGAFRSYYNYEPDTSDYPNGAPEPRYLMQINGRRIFARGSNWNSCDLLFGRTRKIRYEYLVRSAAEANCNLFRAWGGGTIEKEEFLELCDQYGILLFYEFPWAGPRPPDTEEALKISERETREILPLLMNHPSVVRYGGGNEWRLTAKTNRHIRQLQEICNEVDPSRPFHGPDPETPFQRHGSYFYHKDLYSVFGSAEPMEWTEFGVAGAASIEQLRSIMPVSELWPVNSDNPNWIQHNAFYAYGNDQWLGQPCLTELFGDPMDLPSLVQHSQLIQAEGLRYGCQAMRRFRWHRSACATWVFNEPWPNAAHDSIVEYYGRKPMAYYYLKQAYAPIDVLAVYSSLEISAEKPLNIEIWATNDHLHPLTGFHCLWKITDLNGALLAENQLPAEVPAEGSVRVADVDWMPPLEMSGSVALVWLELFNASNNIVAQHLYTFGIAPADSVRQPLLSAMLKVPQTTLKSRIKKINVRENAEAVVTLDILNEGPVTALFVKTDVILPEVDASLQNPPVLDWCYFDTNGFSLLPGECRCIVMTLASHAPKSPVIKVAAWNSEESFHRIDLK